jgi:hypothetical protein
MSLQSIKTKLLTASLFTASTCGTFALFGCVPMLARMVPSNPQFLLGKLQEFSQQVTSSSFERQAFYPNPFSSPENTSSRNEHFRRNRSLDHSPASLSQNSFLGDRSVIE